MAITAPCYKKDCEMPLQDKDCNNLTDYYPISLLELPVLVVVVVVFSFFYLKIAYFLEPAPKSSKATYRFSSVFLSIFVWMDKVVVVV